MSKRIDLGLTVFAHVMYIWTTFIRVSYMIEGERLKKSRNIDVAILRPDVAK
jgi:hypothetical protein